MSFFACIVSEESVAECRKYLLAAGCTHEARKHKVPALVLEILGL